ncbi:MAG: hypothetical protein WAT39_02210 [Planctomycetota bacterium]
MCKLAFLVALVLAAPLPWQGKAKHGFVVVVHSSNACSADAEAARSIVKKLFLKEMSQWPAGVDARPYAREGTTAEQTIFLKVVLGMTDAEIARHWLKMKNMSGTTPPKCVDNERLVLKYVARHEGAFGVVRADAVKGVAGVRVLFEF